MEELLSVLLEASINTKQRIDDLNEVVDLLKDETKANQNDIQATKEAIQKQIDDLIIQTSKMIDKVATSIKAENVDYEKIETFIKDNIQEVDYQKIEDFIKSIIPKPKNVTDGIDGTDGKDADNELIIQELKDYIEANKDNFRGLPGKPSKDGINGINGADGVGIEDIALKNQDLVITLTNKRVIKLKMPKQIQYLGGGGSSSSSADLSNYYTKEQTNLLLDKKVDIISLVCYENIGGHRVAYADSDNKVRTYLADTYKPVAGVTLTSGVVDGNVTIKTSGLLSSNTFMFEPNKPVFVKSNGTLSTTVPIDTDYYCIIGVANSTNSLVINSIQIIKKG